jgi:hypothetical protein
VRGVRGLDSKERERGLEPAKESELIQERIEPTSGDAVIHIERLSMVPLVMLRI